MMSTSETGQDAIETLAAVVRLLCRCTDMAFEQAQGQPVSSLPSLGLGAQLLASEAMDLLPDGVDVDQPVPGQTDPVQLLRAAEVLTRAYPIEKFPPGTSQVIVGICDLIREHPA